MTISANLFSILTIGLRGEDVYSFIYMGFLTTKPVFGVSDKVRYKPVCSATGTSQKNEISLVASLDTVG